MIVLPNFLYCTFLIQCAKVENTSDIAKLFSLKSYKIPILCIFSAKDLHNQKNNRTFAPDLRNNIAEWSSW